MCVKTCEQYIQPETSLGMEVQNATAGQSDKAFKTIYTSAQCGLQCNGLL